MSEEPDIKKAGALILDEEGRLLIAKSKKRDIWMFVGGKLEGDETHEESLQREVLEELGVPIEGYPTLYLVSPIEQAAGQDKTIQIKAYLVEIDGLPQPTSELEALHWLTKAEFESGNFELASILGKYAIPQLIEDGKLQ